MSRRKYFFYHWENMSSMKRTMIGWSSQKASKQKESGGLYPLGRTPVNSQLWRSTNTSCIHLPSLTFHPLTQVRTRFPYHLHRLRSIAGLIVFVVSAAKEQTIETHLCMNLTSAFIPVRWWEHWPGREGRLVLANDRTDRSASRSLVDHTRRMYRGGTRRQDCVDRWWSCSEWQLRHSYTSHQRWTPIDLCDRDQSVH